MLAASRDEGYAIRERVFGTLDGKFFAVGARVSTSRPRRDVCHPNQADPYVWKRDSTATQTTTH